MKDFKIIDSFYKISGSKKQLMFLRDSEQLLLRIMEGEDVMSIVIDEKEFDKCSKAHKNEGDKNDN